MKDNKIITASKIALGTVQFGLDYGISNSIGQTKQKDAFKILNKCRLASIGLIDTASSYGESEKVIGESIPNDVFFNIVTKTPPINHSYVTMEDCKGVKATFMKSLALLKQQQIYGLLVHQANDLMKRGSDNLYKMLLSLKKEGYVNKVGVSIYTAKDIDFILEHYDLDIIQLPFNVFDQRLLKSGHLKRIKQRGIEIHCRSVFLQGLLFMNPNKLPPFFKSIREHLQQYQLFCQKNNLSILESSLRFVINSEEIDYIICGVNNLAQLNDIVNASNNHQVRSKLNYQEFALTDENILNPSKWIINKNE